MKKKIIIIAITFALCIRFFMWLSYNYNLRSPFEKVIRIPASEVTPIPVKNKQETKQGEVLAKDDETTSKIAEIIVGVRELESGNCNAVTGYHKVCEAKGLRNCVGYDTDNDFCFEDEDDEIGTLNKWFKERLAKRPLADVLCEYNTGTVGMVNCTYYQKFINLQI